MTTEMPTSRFRALFAAVAALEASLAQVPVELRATLADEKQRLLQEMADWITNASNEADYLS